MMSNAELIAALRKNAAAMYSYADDTFYTWVADALEKAEAERDSVQFTETEWTRLVGLLARSERKSA